MNTDSIKARLKNFAIKNRCTFQEALTYYGLERLIYRISISKYSDHFVLKGGILLYAIFECNYERATTDVDLLAIKISNSKEEMKIVFNEIFSKKVDDGLVFDFNSLNVEDITTFKEYHGLHVTIMAYLDKTEIPINIDIGFGDIVYPGVNKISFPSILNMDLSIINAYSIVTSIAEKLEAIVHNGYLNSRYKDFYDVYVLLRTYDLFYDDVENAIEQTFENRNTKITMDCIIFNDEFLKDSMHQKRWKSFLKKKKTLIDVSLEETMDLIRVFVYPIINDVSKIKWNSRKCMWE